MRAGNLIRRTRGVGKVVMTMEGFVMAAGEGGDGRIRGATRQLGLRFGMADGAAEARLKPEIGRVGLVATDTFCAFVTATTVVLAYT